MNLSLLNKSQDGISAKHISTPLEMKFLVKKLIVLDGNLETHPSKQVAFFSDSSLTGMKVGLNSSQSIFGIASMLITFKKGRLCMHDVDRRL